jgi:hypothetical protein
MTLHQWLALEGALVVTGCCFLALAAFLWVARQVYWWRRYVSLCGSERSAMNVVRAGEAVFLTNSTGDN